MSFRWPWVSRESYEAARAYAEGFRVLLREEQARYAELLEKYHQLRIDKLANPVRFPTEEQIREVEQRHEEDTLGIEIEQAIDDRAQGDKYLIRQLWNDARRMLDNKMSPTEVADAILRGAQTDD